MEDQKNDDRVALGSEAKGSGDGSLHVETRMLKLLVMECLDEGHTSDFDGCCRHRGMAIRCGICAALEDVKREAPEAFAVDGGQGSQPEAVQAEQAASCKCAAAGSLATSSLAMPATGRNSAMTPQDSTEARIAEIREREQKATQGPWTNGVRGSGPSGDAHMCRIIARGYKGARNPHIAGAQIGETWDPKHIVSYVGLSRQECVDNAEFMAHAREDIPYLLGRLNEQAQVIAKLERAVDGGQGALPEAVHAKQPRNNKRADQLGGSGDGLRAERIEQIRERWDGFDWSLHGKATAGVRAVKDITYLLSLSTQQREENRRLASKLSWLEGTAIPHALRQENANGFQRGWHAALSRVGEGDNAASLAEIVPEPCANPDDTLPLALNMPTWKCKTCGCVWRDNLDESVSLLDANQKSCQTCEHQPTREACELHWLAVVRESDALSLERGGAESALAAARAENERLRDWRATVTAALRREGGAFYEDVPRHIRALIARVEAAEAERDQARAEIERLKAVVQRQAEAMMQCVDASWRPNEAKDWSRPELVLAEYLADRGKELERLKAEVVTQNTDADYWLGAVEAERKRSESAESALTAAREEIERLQAAQGWRPIETAPKDGTEVLLMGSHWKRVGYWARRIERWSVDTVVSLSEPTHWMPLPPPPAKGEATP